MITLFIVSQKGLKNVFDEAILAALEPPEPRRKRKCNILWFWSNALNWLCDYPPQIPLVCVVTLIVGAHELFSVVPQLLLVQCPPQLGNDGRCDSFFIVFNQLLYRWQHADVPLYSLRSAWSNIHPERFCPKNSLNRPVYQRCRTFEKLFRL